MRTVMEVSRMWSLNILIVSSSVVNLDMLSSR